MLFDLINAPTTFQTYINKSLTSLIDNFCVVYLDDILIYSSSQEEHLDYVKQVLERLRRFSLYTSLKKCEFFITEVEFLDFMMFIDDVAMNKRVRTSIESSHIGVLNKTTRCRTTMYWEGGHICMAE